MLEHPPFLGAIGHQVLAAAGFAAVLTGFSHVEENDKRSIAFNYKGCSALSVSDLSQQFFDALRKNPAFLAV
ncbi:hypothetical protein [Pseudomonas frederiksbergensis]|uniref:hypothetical protein n=1 Tax=Pseudomonas frederiksbergensis TaxID=104087 RepID=UPI0011CE1109|nr:hypothetical protein [Pseudomonas frederiksbergensis]